MVSWGTAGACWRGGRGRKPETDLAHKSRNYTVKSGSLVTKSFLSRTKLTEVFASLRYHVIPQLHRYASRWLAADGHIEKDGGVRASRLTAHGHSAGHQGPSSGCAEKSTKHPSDICLRIIKTKRRGNKLAEVKK